MPILPKMFDFLGSYLVSETELWHYMRHCGSCLGLGMVAFVGNDNYGNALRDVWRHCRRADDSKDNRY